MRTRTLTFTLAALLLAAPTTEATHSREFSKKHKVFYHLNEAGNAKAVAVLTNIQNHVDTVGWQNIEALELVVHGPALKTFLARDLDPEVGADLTPVNGSITPPCGRAGDKRRYRQQAYGPKPHGLPGRSPAGARHGRRFGPAAEYG